MIENDNEGVSVRERKVNDDSQFSVFHLSSSRRFSKSWRNNVHRAIRSLQNCTSQSEGTSWERKPFLTSGLIFFKIAFEAFSVSACSCGGGERGVGE